MEFVEVKAGLLGGSHFPLLKKSVQRFTVGRVVVMSCLAKRISITRLRTQSLLVVSMQTEILQRSLMKSLVSGVINAIDHSISERLARRFMGNHQIERVIMQAGLAALLLHMRPNLSPLAKSRWINF